MENKQRLVLGQPRFVQYAGREFGRRLATLQTTIPLEAFIFTEFLAFMRTGTTRQLDLSRPSLTVMLYLPDTTEGFGLWLRPVSAETLAGHFVLLLYELVRSAPSPFAFGNNLYLIGVSHSFNHLRNEQRNMVGWLLAGFLSVFEPKKTYIKVSFR
jgi:hypothetical protein